MHLWPETHREITEDPWEGSHLPFESHTEPKYHEKPATLRAAFSLTVEPDDPGLPVQSKIMAINVPDYHWFMKKMKPRNSTALRPFVSLVRGGQAIDNAWVIGVVGKDPACPWRKHTSDSFFNQATWDWVLTKLSRDSDTSVDDEYETPESSRSASPPGDTNSDGGNQELQPGAGAEGYATDDDANSDGGNQELQPGAGAEGYATAGDTANSDGGNQELQPGAGAEGHVVDDDTTNSEGDIQQLQPGASAADDDTAPKTPLQDGGDSISVIEDLEPGSNVNSFPCDEGNPPFFITSSDLLDEFFYGGELEEHESPQLPLPRFVSTTGTSSTAAPDPADLSDAASDTGADPDWEVLEGQSIPQILLKLFLRPFGFSYVGPISDEFILEYLNGPEFRAVPPFRPFLLTRLGICQMEEKPKANQSG